MVTWTLLYLDSVVSVVEQVTSSESVKYRIVRVVHHVVSADGRQAVPLQIIVYSSRMVQVWISTLFLAELFMNGCALAI